MAMVEEVWKNQDGKYFGIHSGKEYEKGEVDEVHEGCYWTKPRPLVDGVFVEVEKNPGCLK
jgi:hypothetical protein